MGKYAAGFGYETKTLHEFDFLVGVYPNGEVTYIQLNLNYRYTPWEMHSENNKRIWRPFRFGAFTTRSLDGDHYFAKSPDRYPSADYYDKTAFRFGVELSHSLVLPSAQLSLSYRLRLLDNGFVALYNNSHKDLRYYLSSGISVSYLF